MARTDIHLDAMLRHLGAAYYESLQGRATRADVNRALDTVEEHLKGLDQAGHGVTPAPAGRRRPRAAGERHHSGRWQRRVRDVMTTSVVTVDRLTPYKEITRLLAERRISGVPVLAMGQHVVGVVTEADLLVVEAEDTRRARMRGGRRFRWPTRQPAKWGLTAGELMTTPPVTIHPDATVSGAARVMNSHHVRRLPVVDPAGKLLGVISRRDLLSVFLRPDTEITENVQNLLDDVLRGEAAGISAVVRNGVVVLNQRSEAPVDREMTAMAVRLIWNVDGVVDVVTRIVEHRPSEPEQATPPRSPVPAAPGPK
ncbi:MAG TPA: CBS domain-containing protein [Streptosporangiaceae bacterium]|nr:CBS domain-containing protein [Streptosporangiaceae bacterium]